MRGAAIDGQAVAVLDEAIRLHDRSTVGRTIQHANTLYFLACQFGYFFAIHAAVDEGRRAAFIMVVDHPRLPMHDVRAVAIHVVMVRLMGMEVTQRQVVVVMGTQSEVEMDADVGIVVAEAIAAAVVSVGGQGSPTSVGVGSSPADPGGPPITSGRPDPAVVVVLMPAAIVERRPAPAVVGLPVPAVIRVQPTATITVGTPVDVERGDSGLPTPPVGRDVHPSSIGIEGGLKVGNGFLDFINDGLCCSGLSGHILNQRRLFDGLLWSRCVNYVLRWRRWGLQRRGGGRTEDGCRGLRGGRLCGDLRRGRGAWGEIARSQGCARFSDQRVDHIVGYADIGQKNQFFSRGIECLWRFVDVIQHRLLAELGLGQFYDFRHAGRKHGQGGRQLHDSWGGNWVGRGRRALDGHRRMRGRDGLRVTG